jgi:polysaccharide biosynthesis protein PslH
MRDLLVTPYTPTLGNGRALRTYAIARALSALELGPDVLHVRFGGERADAAFCAIDGIRFFEVVPSRGLRRALSYASTRADGTPRGFARGVSPELVSLAATLAQAEGRGRVITDGPTAAAATLGLAKCCDLVYCAHNLETRFRPELRNRRGRAFEKRLFEGAREVWLAAEDEIAAARELSPASRVRYVPNAVDVTAIEPVRERPREHRVLLVGDYSYAPNRRALQFLLDDVSPRLWELVPDASIVIAGKHARVRSTSDGRIEYVGFAPRLADVYARVDCVAVPLLEGGGSPLKFIEAMAYGVPVVATPVAARGLRVAGGKHYLEAEHADEFAGALARVLQDGAPDLARAARELVEREYSIEAVMQRVAP